MKDVPHNLHNNPNKYPRKVLMEELEGVRRVVSSMAFTPLGDRTKDTLPGLCQKKGLEPLLPMFQ